MTVGGLFTDETSFAIDAGISLGGAHTLSLLACGTISERGLRSYAVREAFDLTGDRYYNPAWGYWDGRQRNAKTTAGFQPFTMINYTGAISDKLTITTSLAYRFGAKRYGSLANFDADSPYPDYYRSMPDYADGLPARELLEEAWRDHNPAFVNVNWLRLWEVNKMRGDGHAAYIVENAVESIRDLRMAATVEIAITQAGTLRLGAQYTHAGENHYKEVGDMLGGAYILNRDKFTPTIINNLREDASRQVRQGDRFDYDYDMLGRRYAVSAIYRYARPRLRISAGIELGQTALWRYGNYERSNFSGNLSHGASVKSSFATYSVKVTAGYSISPRSNVEITGHAAEMAPYIKTLFISPQYANKTVTAPATVKAKTIEASYSLSLRALRIKAAGFLAVTSDEVNIYRHWHDIESRYTALVMSGIGKRCFGAEIGIEAYLSSALTVSVAASAGDYSYSGNPAVNMFEDNTMRPMISGSKSYLEGYRMGGAPAVAIGGELRYAPRGWLTTLSFGYASGRYMEPTPLRRIEHIYTLVKSAERFDEFVAQERLPDAFVAGIMVLKSFKVLSNTLTAMLSVSNLLDNRNIIYNGYEQMRVTGKGSGASRVYSPMPSKYLYGYGRTYYASLTYKF
jgi:hypothetical protein